MARVVGLGGVFFKAEQPEVLLAWYSKWLGMEVEHGSVALQRDSMPSGSISVWSPFARDTDYFEPSQQSFMINLMVDDLDGALSQVVEGGAALAGDVQEYDYGRFGWFIDPEGNKVELWQPPAA
jgi:predicted enzyme related to lactoylglutathione lyase